MNNRIINILAIIGGVASLVAIAILRPYENGNNMIEFYCSPGSVFLWMDLSSGNISIYCPGIVIATHLAIGIFIWLTIGYLGRATVNARRKPLVRFLHKRWQAKVIIASVVIQNEIYIVIANEESWLSAKNVRGYTSFIFHVDSYNGHIKWENLPMDTVGNTISPKKRELLHFATINPELNHFTIHKTGRELFVPRSDNIFEASIHITGKMFLGKFECSRIVLDYRGDLFVDYRWNHDIGVKIERQR